MNDNISVLIVAPHMLKMVWGTVAPLLQMSEEVADKNTCSDVTKYIPKIESGEWKLISMIDGDKTIAVAIVMIDVAHNGVRSLIITSVGGSGVKLWGPKFMALCREIGRHEKCARLMTMVSRTGWIKLGKPYGWEEVHTTYTCDLGEQQ